MVAPATPRFDLGRIIATPTAIRALEEAGQTPAEFLRRHHVGQWGDLDTEDRQANEDALRTGARLLSDYVLSTGVRIWIITEAVDDADQRSATTILLPEEY